MVIIEKGKEPPRRIITSPARSVLHDGTAIYVRTSDDVTYRLERVGRYTLHERMLCG